MKIAFLIYDSRSGSTLFSREFSARFERVFVTPEIGFDRLFARGEGWLARLGWEKVLRTLYSGHEFRNFDVPYERALSLVKGQSLADGVRILIAEFARQHKREDAQWVVVKNGRHIRYWKKMKGLFGDDLFFLHVVRDPRAVINSKLRTRRPYHPEEVMAWGGVAPAAVRWKSYVNSIGDANANGVKTAELRYEDLINDVSGTLHRLAGLLGIFHGGGRWNYQIPDAERSIHGLVLAKGIDNRRAEAWMSELSSWDRCRIEAICSPEMVRLGYHQTEKSADLKKIVACVSELPSIALKVFRHYLRMLKAVH